MADNMTISLGNNTLKDSTKIKDTVTISSWSSKQKVHCCNGKIQHF